MANHTTANLVKAQIALMSEFAENERRFRIPAVFNLFNSTDARRMFPNYDTLKTAVNRSIEANYFLRTSRTVSTGGITHDHTGSTGDSGTLTPTWIPYSINFSMTIKQPNISLWDWQQMFNDNIINSVADFAEEFDEASSNHLFNNRTQVNTATNDGSFNGVTFTYEISEAGVGARAVQISKLVMDVNKYQNQMMDVVCDTISYAKFEAQANQGTGNSTNTSFQFTGVTFIHDPELTTSAAALGYTTGYWEFVPRGTVSALPWIPLQNRNNVETKENKYGQFQNPVDGLTYGTHQYVDRVDGSAVNGQTQDVAEQTQLFQFLALENAPLSTANASTIFAFAYVA